MKAQQMQNLSFRLREAIIKQDMLTRQLNEALQEIEFLEQQAMQRMQEGFDHNAMMEGLLNAANNETHHERMNKQAAENRIRLIERQTAIVIREYNEFARNLLNNRNVTAFTFYDLMDAWNNTFETRLESAINNPIIDNVN
jgi:hypothetical protein